MKLKLAHLYPDLMNIYGDYGNVLCLLQRAKWRELELEVIAVGVDDRLPKQFDMLFIGGGQDRGQDLVAPDLASKGEAIKQAIEAGLPALSICGGYQLFGHYFQLATGERLTGIGVFDVSTQASTQRLIGNIVVESQQFGTLVGFENHSGQTSLGPTAQPLGRVLKGFGNDAQSQTEGVLYKNAIGTYLHGSFLPKNPAVADFLLVSALRNHGIDQPLSPLDDNIENMAHDSSKNRP